MKITKKQRTQLVINLALMLLTLIALVTCVLAWFSNQSIANVDSISSQVERVNLKLISPLVDITFPDATLIRDEQTTPEFFNTHCAVDRTYVIEGIGQLVVQITPGADSKGLLGYVCDSTRTTDYYGELIPKLEERLGKDKTKWTFTKIKEALAIINRRRVGDFNADNNTEIKVVYWVEYDQAQNNLNKESYWDSGESYYANLVFTG